MKITIDSIKNAKKEHRRISALTCYDYSFAKILDKTAIDIFVVGDSLGTVIKGEGTTTHVTLEETIYHCKAVVKGTQRALVVADIPLAAFEGPDTKKIAHIVKIYNETGADAVKIEGAGPMCSIIKQIVQKGIPVMGHLGITPQTASAMGGFKVQGKDKLSAQKILQDAYALQDTGVFSIVLECVIAEVAALITQKLSVPTIGIGSGNGCDGQVLVLYDMLGLFSDMKLKFARQYLHAAEDISAAVAEYTQDIQTGSFPSPQESFTVKELDFLKELS